MRFSTRAEYGLKAMTSLASAYPETLAVREISLREHIPSKYLERIIGILRRQNLVKSFKGNIGGYALSKNPRNMKVGEIIEALDGPIRPMGCESPECQAVSCGPKKIWINLGKLMRKNLYSIKLSELIK